jgi:thioredoxin reductase (NADPH)
MPSSSASAACRADAVRGTGLAIDDAGYVPTGGELTSLARFERWTLERQLLPLETNLQGLFAAGDVRRGSTKRCAAAVREGSMSVALVHQRLAELGGE